jgi:oligopeptidase B
MSGRLLFASRDSSDTSEVWFYDLALSPDVSPEMKCIQPRQTGLRYFAEHDGYEGLLIWTNKDGAVNNKLMHTLLTNTLQQHWSPVLDYCPERMINDVLCLNNYVVVEGRQDGLTQIWVMDKTRTGTPDASSLRRLSFDEDLYEVEVSTNKEFNSSHVRITYASFTTPTTWYDYALDSKATNKLFTIKQDAVLNFDSSAYVASRAFATAPDGRKIPMSMVRRRDLYEPADGKAEGPPPTPQKCLLYGYGSYGICIDPGFHRMILPYLDRGVVYCIAHVRGGGELGRPWYEQQGKYLNKRNTFSDFIACAETLIDSGYTAPSLLAAEGRSAGGLLMGAVVNQRPDLFKIVVAGVPFVDVMNTMCDPSIPLTTGEWEEWGNPNEMKWHDYMLSYSPYDNVRAQPYPNIFVSAGLWDPRVAYWEPAKWVSKLRTLKTDANDVMLKMDLDAGHFSASDRYKYIREKAYEQAVVLNFLGHESTTPTTVDEAAKSHL